MGFIFVGFGTVRVYADSGEIIITQDDGPDEENHVICFPPEIGRRIRDAIQSCELELADKEADK